MACTAAGVVVVAASAASASASMTGAIPRAVDDLVVDECGHGRERTDRRDRRRRARVLAARRAARRRGRHRARRRRRQRDRPSVRVVRGRDERRRACPGRRSPSGWCRPGARHEARPAARQRPRRRSAAPRPATSTRSLVRFATSSLIVGRPRGRASAGRPCPSPSRSSRTSTRRARPEAAQRAVRAVQLAHDRRPTCSGTCERLA